MIVAELYRYPVKSLGGEALETAEIDDFGIVGDRRLGIVDISTGHFLTARREPRLLHASSRWLGDGEVEIILPDGSPARSDDDLSEWLGKAVALVEAPVGGASYESALDAERETEWYTWTGPGQALHDESFARVSLVSHERLGAWDVKRLRSNIVFEGGDERELLGRTVRLGSAVVTVKEEIPRCVMVTRPQPGLERDLGVLKTINNEHGGRFSVGALVAEAGTISVGDRLRIE